ncbi:MAG: oligosaccharide flippase family protein [Oscillospiraceae bacterium]|nr:oligosaccharide flippase family protein [Oscillospiraceae bacterium]
MRRESKLAFNTLLFAVSNFGSKALSFFLVPFYTAVLTTEQYGTADLISASNSLLLPVITLCISDAALRFVMDKENDKSEVFVTGLFVVAMGTVAGFIIIPILSGFFDLEEYWFYSAVILLFDCFYLFSSQFCRGISKTVQFALAGILQTLVFVVSNIIFLLVFSWGVKGYLVSMALSYLIPFVFLFFSAGLYSFLKGKINKKLFLQMAKYALPLIPNTVLWWVMNASDKFFISNMLGKDFNGIYAVSYKFPSIINMINTFFFQAWQISAIEEVDSGDRTAYYSSVFKNLCSFIMLGMSGVLFILKPLFAVWTAEDYYSAWQYTPLLLFATMFMCFSSFWGSNLVAVKKTGVILRSAVAGGAANIVLNAVLIPVWGLYGAAFATLVGFFLTWLVRFTGSRDCCAVKIDYAAVIINLSLLVLQAAVLYFENYMIFESLLLLIFIIVNRKFVKSVFDIAFAFLKKMKTRGKQA